MKKNIKSIVLAIVLLAFFVVCSSLKKIKVDNYQTIIPPGTKEVAMNLYCDETEVTNMFWLDYLHWIKLVYGDNSEEYKSAMPDTTVWNAIYSDSIAWLVNSSFLFYPVEFYLLPYPNF